MDRRAAANIMTRKNDKRPILCGTDFSATATEAVDVAAAMARRLETKLVLVHVDQLLGVLVSNPLVLEAAILQRRGDLDDEAKRLRDLGTEVEEKFFAGSAFGELVTAAKKSKARLVVIGAVGHGLARRLLLGSVAERTAETSPVPTLVVRPGGRFASWIRREHPLKVLVGYDFSPASDTALGWVNQLREIAKSEVTVLYSNWPPDEARRLGYEGPLPLTTNPKRVQENLERDLKKRVATFLPTQQVTTMVEPGWGNPEGYLFQIATREHVDLIVVGTHQRRGLGRALLGSISRNVLHHAKVTVAVIPPTGTATRKHAR
jgi:nucleotide-binding universal stress UspA family protein